MAIITEYIAYRNLRDHDHDWVAFYNGDQESGSRGYGSTETQAIAELNEYADE